MTHFNLLAERRRRRERSHAGTTAWWSQAASTRLGIPVTISTDPRHSFTENLGAAMLSGPFSQWPDALVRRDA
jgi:beta-glucosidase